MKLRNLKYALLISASLGTNKLCAAVSQYDVNGDTTTALSNPALLWASAVTTFQHKFTAAQADTQVYLNASSNGTSRAVIFDSTLDYVFGLASPNNIVLNIMSSAAVTLDNSVGVSNLMTFYPPSSGHALNLRGGGTVNFTGTLPVFNTTADIGVYSNSTIDFNAHTGVNLTAPIYIDSGYTLTIANTGGAGGDSFTLSGVISGGGNLVWAGSGTLTLTANNTLNGTIKITGGGTITYSPVSGAAITQGTITISRAMGNQYFLQNQRAAGVTFNNIITDSTAEGIAVLNTTNLSTFAHTLGTGLSPNNIVLDVASSGNVILNNGIGLYHSTNGGALRLRGGGVLQLGTSGPATAQIPTFNGSAYIDVTSNAYIDFYNVTGTTLAAPIHIATGYTLTVQDTGGSSTNSNTLSGIISGGGNLIWAGSGTLTLGGANTFTGYLYASNSGTIVKTNSVAETALAIYKAQVLQSPTSTTTYAALTAIGGSEAVAYLNTSNTATFTSTIGANVANQNVVLAVMGTGQVNLSNTNIFYGSPTGGSLRLYGSPNINFPASVPVFSTLNNYSSYIDVINSSTITFSVDGLTLAADIVVQSGKVLTINVGTGNSATMSGVISGAGSIVKTGAGTLYFTGTNTYTGTTTNTGTGLLYLKPLALTDGQTYATAIAVNSGVIQPFNISNGTARVSSIISGAGGIQKLGAGTVEFSGANTFTGSVYLGDGTNAAGTLSVLNAAGLGAGSNDIVVNASSVATLGFGSVAVPLPLFTSTRTIPLSDNLILSVPVAGNIITLNGVISGAKRVSKLGAGRVNFGAVNTYSNNTVISEGVVGLSYVTSLGTGTLTTGNALNSLVSIYMPTGTATYPYGITLSGYTEFQIVGATDNVTFSSAFSSTGKLQKSGAGIMTLTGANSHTGGTVLNGGTVRIGIANALSDSATSVITVSTATILDWTGNYSLFANQDLVLNAPLTFNVPTGFTGTITGDITTISAAGTMSKTGAGILTLTPNERNTQATNIAILAGKIVMGGSLQTFGTGSAVMTNGTIITTDGSARYITNTAATGNAVLTVA